MTSTNITTIPLVYKGEIIEQRGETISLTDMWKANGAPSGRAPSDWGALVSTKEFISVVEASLPVNMGNSHNAGNSGIITKKGKGGGSRAHWQVALAYAKYLSPEFHMWCNDVVRAHMQGRAISTAQHLTKYDAQVIGNIVKNCTGVVLHEQLATLLPTMLDAMVAAKLAEQNFLLRHGKTAKQIWDAHHLPPKLKGSAAWFGNRLAEMGCSIENEGRFDRGASAIRLFDPDKAAICLRNGLLQTARQYASERVGQTALRLVGGRAA